MCLACPPPARLDIPVESPRDRWADVFDDDDGIPGWVVEIFEGVVPIDADMDGLSEYADEAEFMDGVSEYAVESDDMRETPHTEDMQETQHTEDEQKTPRTEDQTAKRRRLLLDDVPLSFRRIPTIGGLLGGVQALDVDDENLLTVLGPTGRRMLKQGHHVSAGGSVSSSSVGAESEDVDLLDLSALNISDGPFVKDVAPGIVALRGAKRSLDDAMGQGLHIQCCSLVRNQTTNKPTYQLTNLSIDGFVN